VDHVAAPAVLALKQTSDSLLFEVTQEIAQISAQGRAEIAAFLDKQGRIFQGGKPRADMDRTDQNIGALPLSENDALALR
jgi:hypothetical protein